MPRSTPHRHLAAFAALLLALVFLAAGGCDDRSTENSESGNTSGTSANTLTIALQSGGDTLDPHQAHTAASQRLVENMYSTLMRLSEDYPEVEPDLLADYQVSDDLRTFELTLREGVTFHSGNALTAEDVAFSLNRIKELGTSQPLTKLASIEVHDDTRLTLQFDEPMSPLMTYLAKPTHAIVDQQVVEANDGNIDRVDAGSGPFQLAEWRTGRSLTLERFDDYYVPDRPRLDRLVYRPIPDSTARMIALSNGEVDVVLDVPVAAVDQLEQEQGITVESVPGTFWEYIGLNTRQPPFDDARVRRAIAHAIDREAINQGVKYGRARVLTGGPIPAHHWAHADLNLYPEPNLEAARELLAEAGHADGFSTELIVGVDFSYQVDAAQMISQMLQPIGIEARVNHLESSQFFSRLNNGEFEMTVVGWAGFVEADEWFANLYHSEGISNQQGYSDGEVDRLIAAGRSTGERSERRAIYADLQERIATDAPTVFLYMNPRIGAYRDNVQGFDIHPTVTTISARDAHK